jgi:arylsulfotransferase ASST
MDAGTPFLTELAVSGAGSPEDGSAPITLVPAFSPDTYDYYVRCAAGGSALEVMMSAAPGFKSYLMQPTESPTLQTQTLSLTVAENQAIVAAATDGRATTEYWVRCLPHDFPQLEMSSYLDAGTPTPGYYLIGNYAPITGTGCYAMVLDGNAVPVWYYLAEHGYLNDVDNLVSGSISFAHYTPDVEQDFEFHQLSPVETTYVEPSDTVLDEHELRVLPNGHYLVISNPVLSGVDLTGVSISFPDGGVEKFGPNSSIQDCDLVEFDPATGEVFWQWTGSEHLDPVKDSTISLISYNQVTGPDGGLVVDSFHCNSIDVDENGSLLVSARHMDSIFYVDRTTGAILWKMGGSTYTKDDAGYVAVADPFYRQHDARLQPGWSSACSGGRGQISLFDDQSFESAPARAVVYDVLVGSGDGGTSGCDGGEMDGGSPGTATVSWQRKGVANSLGMGSFRILADGSRTIGWGAGTPNPAFTEVDGNGNALLEVSFVDGNGSYRAIKVPTTALDLEAMRRAVGLP